MGKPKTKHTERRAQRVVVFNHFRKQCDAKCKHDRRRERAHEVRDTEERDPLSSDVCEKPNDKAVIANLIVCGEAVNFQVDLLPRELVPDNSRLDDTIVAVAVSSCGVPINLQKKVKLKLCEMEMQGIIAKVDKPTYYLSRMAVSLKKSGFVRICIDPQDLNGDLKRELHPLPIIEDVLLQLAEDRLFTKVNLRNGFWHCELDGKSSYLYCFQTPCYRWLRLPFGLAVRSELFRKWLHAALSSLEGVVCVVDDRLVHWIH